MARPIATTPVADRYAPNAAVIYAGEAVRYSKVVVWWGVGAAVMAAALVGCGSGDVSIDSGGSTSDDTQSATGLDGPVMRHLEAYANEGEDAEVGGVVEIEGDCLYVSFDEGGERYPIVWPAATSWDADAERVVLPNGDSVGHGDSVYGGGGYRYVADVEAAAGTAAADLAGECVDNQYGEIAVVNNQPEAIGAGDRPVDRDEQNAEPVDETEIEGDWVVKELRTDGAQIGLDPAWPVMVTIDGKVISGTAACNQYVGRIDWSYEAGYGRFIVSELSWTEIGCETQAMEIEQSFLAALQTVDSYEAADGLYVGSPGVATNFHLVRESQAD